MTISFVTTTSYGTWLPGNARGYVSKGEMLPGDAKLFELSRNQLKKPPIYFSTTDRDRLFSALVASCLEFGYRLSDATIEAWHLHWIFFHGDDAIEAAVGRLKTRIRQALSRGRIWTEKYCAEPLFDNAAVEKAQEYIARHAGCMMLNGLLVDRKNPRQSRGLPVVR